MSQAPIEMREYYRLWTRDDALRGTLPQRLPVGPLVNGFQPHDLFVRVGLQYRCLAPHYLNGAKTYLWGEWQDCPIALQGYMGADGESASGAPKEKGAPTGAPDTPETA